MSKKKGRSWERRENVKGVIQDGRRGAWVGEVAGTSFNLKRLSVQFCDWLSPMQWRLVLEEPQAFMKKGSRMPLSSPGESGVL